MRFSRLRLTGFKSFVDPTDLVIQDGLTGVVGPNGCGKSNLLEALRWVMGENRPTAMRGGGMEDVIFAGAASRPARNFAEVSLLIDNSERLAPRAFNDSDVLEVVRRITRDVGSAYKVNGKDVRARDVQMLFADASTGAHSPALVRQGQIAELINARPKNRRRVLEEAAGISGLYQRRHEAELKLRSTESNLERIDDLIDQLATQLRQLARQAQQAARYRAIGAELRRAEALLLYRRWKEADEARLLAEADLKEKTVAAARAEGEARKAAQAREAADALLPDMREEVAVAAAVLQRLTVERDRIENERKQAEERIVSLRAQIAQLAADAEREAHLGGDAARAIGALEEEAATLAAAAEGFETKLAELEEAAREAAEVLAEREAALARVTEDVARLAAQHQAAERRVEDARSTLERSTAEAARAREAAARAGAEVEAATARLAEAEAEEQRAQARVAEAEAAFLAAEEARAEGQAREADARAARSSLEGEVAALEAEHAALDRLLAREASEAGQVLDRLQVEHGFEKALGAALADDLRAPEVTGESGSGWIALPGYDEAAPLPGGVTPLSRHVSCPDVLTRRMSQIGLVDRADGDRLQSQLRPGQRLVSPDGDLWRWDGFRVAADDAPSAAALRLEQLNRLELLKQEMTRANARLEAARRAHEALLARLEELSQADQAARDARRDADRVLTEAARAHAKAEADLNLARGRLETLKLAARRHEEAAAEARAELAEAERTLAGLEDLAAKRAEVEDVRLTVEAARMTMMTRRSAFDELRRDGEARARRQAQVARELEEWRRRQVSAGERIADLERRRQAAEAALAEAEQVPGALEERSAEIARRLMDAEERSKLASDRLAEAEAAFRAAERAERDAERAASEAREARAASAARAEAAGEAAEEARQRLVEATGKEPGALLSELEADPDTIPPSDRLEAEVARLRRQRDALGAVNLRAEADAQEVQAEHDELLNEKRDLEEAVRTLRHGIASLNREGRERLLTAFEQVNTNFAMLFRHLFGGGEARLELVESDDPLEAGLEIMCQPPGKKLSTLSLLSGGEQTLTALALIFAVFLANPAPICVLDEVDAPLDDANVGRFCDLLDEMTRRTDTRFLIITHHAVTMSRMDRLFGVTMQEQGVSQLVSVDLSRAEAMVA